MADGQRQPQGANGDARQTLIDSWEMDLDVCKVWDASENRQESDNPPFTLTAPEIMDVHPLRFCSNRKYTAPTGIGHKPLHNPCHFGQLTHCYRFHDMMLIFPNKKLQV